MIEAIGSAEKIVTVRGSRFIGLLRRVEGVSEITASLEDARKRYTDATHIAYGYSIGFERSYTEGLSDDREPHGTAGRPILDQIRGAGLSFCLVAVVRYFGGTKLGTGGLTRAYGATAKATIAAAPKRLLIERRTFRLAVGYDRIDIVLRLIEEAGGAILHSDYGERVEVVGTIPLTAVEEFCVDIRNRTAGKCYPEISESTFA